MYPTTRIIANYLRPVGDGRAWSEWRKPMSVAVFAFPFRICLQR